ncbi:hypothetical protein Taro_047044 [Colocasia esculenta]|uniref:Uncharacterized protein n=1 Tax=Colocasia esculenta TaxID=4460 RepID=A0A843X6S5_COLES|nr:hypothetical protein [Colocasia esculenta]
MAWLDYGHVWLRRDYGSPIMSVGLLEHGRSGHRRQNTIDQLIRRRMCILVGPYLMRPTVKNCITSSSVPLLFASYLIRLITGRGRMTMSARVLARLLRPMTGRGWIAMQRALPSQTWILRLGSTQREGRGRVECTTLRTACILPQCCPHMRVRSLLRHTRVHLLRRLSVV